MRDYQESGVLWCTHATVLLSHVPIKLLILPLYIYPSLSTSSRVWLQVVTETLLLIFPTRRPVHLSLSLPGMSPILSRISSGLAQLKLKNKLTISFTVTQYHLIPWIRYMSATDLVILILSLHLSHAPSCVLPRALQHQRQFFQSNDVPRFHMACLCWKCFSTFALRPSKIGQMQAKPTNQRGGSLANKHMKRKPANRLDGTKCPNDALRCGTHLLRFRATSPRPCPQKHSHWFWSVGVSWELWDSCCNRTPDINKFHWRHKAKAYRHNHSPTNHPKSFSHSEVGLESKSIIWTQNRLTSRIIPYSPISFVLFWETSAVLSRKSSPRSYHSLGLCRLQIGWDLGLAALPSRSALGH